MVAQAPTPSQYKKHVGKKSKWPISLSIPTNTAQVTPVDHSPSTIIGEVVEWLAGLVVGLQGSAMGSEQTLKVNEGVGREKNRIVLQDRDKKLLRLCYEQSFLSYEFVKTNFFQNASDQRLRERIKQLEQGGFIRRLACPTLSAKRVIKLTPVGAEAAESLSTYQLTYNHRFDYGPALHDARVTDLRAYFETNLKTFKSWMPERYLRANNYKGHAPDGALVFDDEKGIERIVAIELELMRKNHDRYEEILEHHFETHRYCWLLYVVASPDDGNFMLKRIQEFKNRNDEAREYLMGVALLSDLKTKGRFTVYRPDSKERFEFPPLALCKEAENVSK